MAKLTRQTHTIFGLSGSTTNFAKFGSQAASAPVKTKDIAAIQELAAWADGWQEAVALNQAPYLEDMNSAMYEHSYQIGDILQMGVPEWDAGTTYYTGGVVKAIDAPDMYVSIGNNNLNNALPASGASNASWQYIGGKALFIQMVVGTHSGTDSTTSTSFTNSSLAATITPHSVSNKILVLAFTCAVCNSTNGGPDLTVARGSTNIGGSRGLATTDAGIANVLVPASMAALDSPASVSAQTYTMQFKVNAAGTATVGAANLLTCIILLEVAQ